MEKDDTPRKSAPYLEDYELFWELIEENWPFYEAAQRISGYSCEELKAEYRARVEEASTPSELYSALEDLTRKLPAGHLSLISKEDFPVYMEIYGSIDTPQCRYLISVMDKEVTRAFYGYTDPKETEERQWFASGELRFDEFPEYKAAYVEVPSMNGLAIEEDGTTLLAFFKDIESRGYEHCIIDIRNNGGGSSAYAQRNIVSPNITETPEMKDHVALVKGGDKALEYLGMCGFDLKPIGELDTSGMNALSADDLENADRFYTMKIGDDGTAVSEKKAFSGRFWLLVGPRVYSSSEYFSVFCKDTGFATLVGEKTGGDGIGTDPLICALPNTGICFRFSTANGLNLDGSCNEEVGTNPDILTEDDALAACLEAIKAGK